MINLSDSLPEMIQLSDRSAAGINCIVLSAIVVTNLVQDRPVLHFQTNPVNGPNLDSVGSGFNAFWPSHIKGRHAPPYNHPMAEEMTVALMEL